MNGRRSTGPDPDRAKFKVPWDEKTGPSPAPERVELRMPWDEAIDLIRTPGKPKREKRER